MNLTDLGAVLRERAAMPDDLSPEQRLDGVRTRVIARRRHLAVTAAAVLVLVVVGVVYAVIGPSGPSSMPAGPRTIEGFPEYANGSRVVAAATGRLPDRAVTVRLVSTTLDLRIFTRCVTPSHQALIIRITVQGKDVAGGTCDATAGSATVPDPKAWTNAGARAGEPFDVTMTVLGAPDWKQPDPVASPLPVPGDGTFAFALGAAVPPSEYPYPPRPSTLVPLTPWPDAQLTLRADPADPNRQRQATVAWSGLSVIESWLNTPGRLRVLVDGVEVHRHESWDYITNQSESMPSKYWPDSLRLEPGQQVTVTVVPERTSGDWYVVLTDAPAGVR